MTLHAEATPPAAAEVQSEVMAPLRTHCIQAVECLLQLTAQVSGAGEISTHEAG
jgi:hypothetical protein